MQHRRDLLQTTVALGAGRGFSHFLHGRQQETDQNGDDGDHHQQLNERETGTAAAEVLWCLGSGYGRGGCFHRYWIECFWFNFAFLRLSGLLNRSSLPTHAAAKGYRVTDHAAAA